MKNYTIKKVSGQPDWDTVPTLSIDHRNTDDPTDVQAWAQIAYDDERLWVHLRAREVNLRTQESGPLARAWEDSCLEFFFCPIPGDSRYFNIELTPTGAMFLGVGSGCTGERIRLLPADRQTLFDIRPALCPDGWELFYSVPYSFIRRLFPDFAVTGGMEMRANCYKCGDCTVQPHYLAWNPPTSENPDFHRPQDFGALIFE